MSKGIALLGAGIFARNEHLPAIKACPYLSLKAIYSRSKASADKLAKLADSAEDNVDTYFETSHAPGRSLDRLLEREDIDAVIIALPTPVQPKFIKKAIGAGKHVLGEKPIATDVTTAESLLRWYKKEDSEAIWGVGENFRFMDHIRCGARQINELGGDVVTFSTKLFGFLGENDEYAQTDWRRSSQVQGGFLLAEGVHYIAAIRYLLAAASEHITAVSAFTSLLQPHLAPLDTLHSIQQLSNGNNGTFSLSFGAEFKHAFEFQVVTDRGTVTVTSSSVVIHKENAQGEKTRKEHKFDAEFKHCVKEEVAAFAKVVKTGKRDWRMSPEEALKDLRIVQGMLESGEGKGKVISLE